MNLLEKVKEIPFICGVYFDFTGELFPVNSKEKQNFYNSQANQFTWSESYFGKKTITFSETSKLDTNQNRYYTQTLKIKFPSTDAYRSDRLEIFGHVKFIRLSLTNNSDLVMGRNDVHQNKKPVCKASSNLKSTTITYTTKSIFPTGFAEILDVTQISDQLLPADVPLTFTKL